MQITNQKRLAARLLKCGVNRVWVNPDYVDQVASAVQTDDIREFIEEGWIRQNQSKGLPESVRECARNKSAKAAEKDKVSVQVQLMLGIQRSHAG